MSSVEDGRGPEKGTNGATCTGSDGYFQTKAESTDYVWWRVDLDELHYVFGVRLLTLSSNNGKKVDIQNH